MTPIPAPIPPIAVVALGDPSQGDDGIGLRVMGRVRTLIAELGCIRTRKAGSPAEAPGDEPVPGHRRHHPGGEEAAGSGLGPLAALFLSEEPGAAATRPPLIEWVEGGPDPRRLDPVLLGRRRVVLVDAVQLGQPPGTVYHWHLRCSPENSLSQVRQLTGRPRLGLQHLALWLEDDLPPAGTDLIGIEPHRILRKDRISPALLARLPVISSQVAGVMVRILEEEGW